MSETYAPGLRERNMVIVERLIGERVRVHWHVREKRYSISCKYGDGKWRVVRNSEGHQLFCGKIVLEEARFIVQPGGKARAIRTGQKNVHAYVEGTLRFFEFIPSPAHVPCGLRVVYSLDYPEPEFKYKSPNDKASLGSLPAIKYADMVSLGTVGSPRPPYSYPNMYAIGVE